MSNLSQGISQFQNWFKASGLGQCKKPDLSTTQERQAAQEKYQRELAEKAAQPSPIYLNSKLKGD